ncbi:MAG: hypothetical protein R3Y32_02340 [Bacillota bacterium]
MKWGLCIIGIGALVICVAGNPETTADFSGIISGLLLVGLGCFVMYASSKMKKRRAQKEALEQEEAEFALEQARKKEEIGKQKERENVEKSRKNSENNGK